MKPPVAHPPRVAVWIMRRLFRDDGFFTPLGDLQEVYTYLAQEHSQRTADRWYWGQVFRAMLPFLAHTLYGYLLMLRAYLTATSRFLLRYKGYASINVFGLALALAIAMLSYLFIQSERTYDQFHPDPDRIYRVGTTVYFQNLSVWENTPFQLADALLTDVPGVEATTRFSLFENKPLRLNQRREEVNVHLVAPSFFSIFDFSLLVGDPTVLDNPNTIILSEAMQARYFGDRPAMGATLDLNLKGQEWETFTVAGIAAPVPDNSSIQFDFLIAESYYAHVFGAPDETNWLPKGRTVTFFRASPQASEPAIVDALNSLASQHGLTRFHGGREVETMLPIEPLPAVHFSPLINNRVLTANGDPSLVYIVGAVALLLLLIACINFVNLSLGLSARRAKEVGVRKVFGAQRRQLLGQYSFEALMMSSIALVLGLLIAQALLPTFNLLANKALTLDMLLTGYNVLVVLGFIIGVGLLAGGYPSFVLSAFKPVAVLRGRTGRDGRHYFGQAMVGFQFAVTIFLIAATLIMARQLRYMSSMDVGYDAELVLVQKVPRGIDDAQLERYRQQAMQHAQVVGLSGARTTLFGDQIGSMLMFENDEEVLTVALSKIDYDFLDVLGLELVAGRNLSPDFPSDATQSVLVNQAFVDAYVEGDPLGAKVPYNLMPDERAQIVGIVQDYHFISLRNTISPMLLNLRPDSDYRQVLTKIQGGDIPGTLAHLQSTWDGLNTGMLFDYTFLDEELANQYQAEQQFRTLSTYASWIAILVACLGLLGMTALAVSRRTKEMGVRKVLGASTGRILLLFNRSFVCLLLGASLLASAAAYLLMDRWLERFAYRITISADVLLIATGLVALIAIATISTQAFQAARRNPVDTLRYE